MIDKVDRLPPTEDEVWQALETFRKKKNAYHAAVFADMVEELGLIDEANLFRRNALGKEVLSEYDGGLPEVFSQRKKYLHDGEKDDSLKLCFFGRQRSYKRPYVYDRDIALKYFVVYLNDIPWLTSADHEEIYKKVAKRREMSRGYLGTCD